MSKAAGTTITSVLPAAAALVDGLAATLDLRVADARVVGLGAAARFGARVVFARVELVLVAGRVAALVVARLVAAAADRAALAGFARVAALVVARFVAAAVDRAAPAGFARVPVVRLARVAPLGFPRVVVVPFAGVAVVVPEFAPAAAAAPVAVARALGFFAVARAEPALTAGFGPAAALVVDRVARRFFAAGFRPVAAVGVVLVGELDRRRVGRGPDPVDPVDVSSAIRSLLSYPRVIVHQRASDRAG